MPIGLPEIVRCPPELLAEALALVLCDLAPSQRREVGGVLLAVENAAELGKRVAVHRTAWRRTLRCCLGPAAIRQLRRVLAAAAFRR